MFAVKEEEQACPSASSRAGLPQGYGLSSRVKSRIEMRRLIILSFADWLPHYPVRRGSCSVYRGRQPHGLPTRGPPPYRRSGPSCRARPACGSARRVEFEPAKPHRGPSCRLGIPRFPANVLPARGSDSTMLPGREWPLLEALRMMRGINTVSAATILCATATCAGFRRPGS